MALLSKFLIVAFKAVRPLFGPASCSFYLTCGNFACEELAQKDTLPALWSIIKRLFACTFFLNKRSE